MLPRQCYKTALTCSERTALKAILFDLEGTLVETIYELDREAVDRLRRETRKNSSVSACQQRSSTAL